MLKNILKKITLIMLIILTIFSRVGTIFAISGSGTATWNAFEQYNSSVKTTDYSTESIYGIMMRSMKNISTGEIVTVFCAQHGVDMQTRRNFHRRIL